MRNRKQHPPAASHADPPGWCGDQLGFAALEAYKLLRTNLTFSLSDDQNRCHVIGVTSAMRREGKSMTAVNLSYTLAETGKKVLLLEGDMRLPVLADRLHLKRTPGLSNLLAGMAGGSEALQHSGLLRNLYVITAGDVPPNPSELLGSDQIRLVVEQFSEVFDYLVIDLPPVSVVSDALAISRLTSGMLVVVRQDYCSKRQLGDAIRQLQFAGVKILGLVMNGFRPPDSGSSYQKHSHTYE